MTGRNRKSTAHAKNANAKNQNNDDDEFAEMSEISARAKRMTLVQVDHLLSHLIQGVLSYLTLI